MGGWAFLRPHACPLLALPFLSYPHPFLVPLLLSLFPPPPFSQLQVAVQNARNPMPSDPSVCPPRLASLIERCWAAAPRDRPHCSEVVDELQALLRACRGDEEGLA